MKVDLAYGNGVVGVQLPAECTNVVEPLHVAGLEDERAAFFSALDTPIGSQPLRQLIKPEKRLCITFSDITRATPNRRIIPWLLEYLSFVPRENITLINQLGAHRPNTISELETLLTPAVVQNYHVLNHDSEDISELVRVGTTRDGTAALINRRVVEADFRIVTGFIEPHFFAGFSGGPKGIMPGTAGVQTIMSNHGGANLAHPNATYGITEGNPLWEEMRDIALSVGPSFLINVTLNSQKKITGVFAGDLINAHKEGTKHVRQTAMCRVNKTYDLVITTNSGYPLDINLYQGI